MAISNSGNLGFIGLGIMGGGMVSNLAEKLPVHNKIYLYDVVDAVMEEKCATYPGKCMNSASPREVAEKSVSIGKTRHWKV